MKQLSFAVFILFIFSFHEGLGQLAPDGKNIFNTSKGYMWNEINPPTRFTDVARGITVPTVRIFNPNIGGVNIEMLDPFSGAEWQIMSTDTGTLKIRDDAHLWDVIVVEKNSFADAIHISESDYVGIGISEPLARLDVRELYEDEGVVFILGTQDLSHKLVLFPGRMNDPNPFIQWAAGDPFRFVTDEGGWSEKMRVSSTGQFAVGTISPDPSALVDFSSTSQGFLAPRMPYASRPASPAPGLIYYQTNNWTGNPIGYYYYDGTDWQRFGKASEDYWTEETDGIFYNAVHIKNSSADGDALLAYNYLGTGTAAVKGVFWDGNFANGMLGVANLDYNPLGLPIDLPYIGVLGIKPDNNTNGAGVFGWNNDNQNTLNYAGVFVADGEGSGTNHAVYGSAAGGAENYAVYGYAAGGTENYAVYGYAAGGMENYAGYFQGKVRANTLQVGNAAMPDDLYYKLSVDGGIACEDVFVALSGSWPDYVFDNGYPLLSLDEFEKSIKENKHLPGMAPASEITGNSGYLIGDVQQKTLEKVEELSLYIIELNHRIKKLEKENLELKKMMSE